MAKFGRMSVRARKNVSIGGVVTALVTTLLSLYVGGTILTQIGLVMNQTSSPFYGGLSLIGWTVDATGKITSVTTSTGSILTVIGIIGVAAIVMQFVEVKFK